MLAVQIRRFVRVVDQEDRRSRFKSNSVENLQKNLHLTGRVFFQVMEFPEGIENQKILAGSRFDDLPDELFVDRGFFGDKRCGFPVERNDLQTIRPSYSFVRNERSNRLETFFDNLRWILFEK